MKLSDRVYKNLDIVYIPMPAPTSALYFSNKNEWAVFSTKGWERMTKNTGKLRPEEQFSGIVYLGNLMFFLTKLKEMGRRLKQREIDDKA